MSETVSNIPRRKPFLNHFLRNPVTVKELRSRMRGRRAFVVLTIYLLAMSGFISFIYMIYAAAANDPFGPDGRQAGKLVFGSVLGVQIFLVIFIGPAFTTGAITGEKERQTYDLLRTTLLSAPDFVLGKLLSALSYVFLLILASLPLQSIGFLLGGVSLVEIVLSQILVFVSALAFAMIGLFFSSMMRSTLASSVMTFGTALLLTIGLPIIVGIALSFIGPFLFGFSSPSLPVILIFIYIGILLASLNLPATIITSEIFLLEQDALFLMTEVIDGRTIYIPTPWYIYTFLYAFLALFLYLLTVRRVKRIAQK